MYTNLFSSFDYTHMNERLFTDSLGDLVVNRIWQKAGDWTCYQQGDSSFVVAVVLWVAALDVASTVVSSQHHGPIFIYAPANASLPPSGGFTLQHKVEGSTV